MSSIVDIPGGDKEAFMRYYNALLLGDDGHMKLLPAKFYQQFPLIEIRIWCSLTARYTIPTIELIEFLKNSIGDRSCIELGAGMGDIGKHLDIKMTDSYIQQSNYQCLYKILGQAVTNPPATVEKIDANAAIEKYQPQVAVASWLTQKTIGIDRNQSNSHGAIEEEILDAVETYIFIGNKDNHNKKRILAKPHKEYTLPYRLITRAENPENNVIWIWQNLNKKSNSRGNFSLEELRELRRKWGTE